MKAFALPSLSEGCIRLNVRGREVLGIVDPEHYGAVCEEIVNELHALRNPRTGAPVVARIRRTRNTANQAAIPGARPSPADLIVQWVSEPVDVVDHPTVGRIGPVPAKRSGSHVHRGFIMAAGPGLPAGVHLPERHALDLAPTILTLLGAPLPKHFEGRPIFEPTALGEPWGTGGMSVPAPDLPLTS
jgi:predicted AlkP superfamily phosphohydrolase/phosphomutase